MPPFAQRGLCQNLCESRVDCRAFSVTGNVCYGCPGGNTCSDDPAETWTAVAGDKGCTPSGRCVLCEGPNAKAIESLRSNTLENVVLMPSGTCESYVVPVGTVTVNANATLRAKKGVTSELGNLAFSGAVSISAPTVTLKHLTAHTFDVTAGNVTADNVVALNGTFALLDSNVNADLSNIKGKVYDVAVSNCQGTVAFGSDAHVVTQDAIAGPAVVVSGQQRHAIVHTNLSALLSTFGNEYEISFESEGVFSTPSGSLVSLALQVTVAACVLAALLPLCHAKEARLLVEGFGRHPHSS